LILTVPSEDVEFFKANDLHKNGHVVLRGSFPCKVVETDWAAPGKHGAAKIRVVGVDLFTSKKYDDIFGSGDNVMVPVIKKIDYQLQFLDDDKYMKLMSLKEAKIRDDMRLNPNDELSPKIEEMYEEVEGNS
jgi:translation initiation factor 5A